MSGRSLRWVGGILTVVAIGGLTAYFAVLGLDRADKLASVIGALSAIAGIALTIHGMIRVRRESASSSPASIEAVPSSHTHNSVSGGTQHGVVIQGRDFYGPISPGKSDLNDQNAQK